MNTGRPKKLKACPYCHEELGAREMRKHRGICAAMRGRKPKPTARRIAEGDTRKQGVHKLAAQLAAEPQTTRGLPDAPEHLTERARDAWDFWASELKDMKLDRRPDAQMLEGCCTHYARAVQADMIVSAEGIMVEELAMVGEGEAAEPVVMKRKAHPAIAVSNDAWRQVRAFCSEFGLSPVSRTRLAVERDDSPEVDLMKVLSAPRPAKAIVQ